MKLSALKESVANNKILDKWIIEIDTVEEDGVHTIHEVEQLMKDWDDAQFRIIHINEQNAPDGDWFELVDDRVENSELIRKLTNEAAAKNASKAPNEKSHGDFMKNGEGADLVRELKRFLWASLFCAVSIAFLVWILALRSSNEPDDKSGWGQERVGEYSKSPYIPEIAAVDLYLNLEKKGFSVDKTYADGQMAVSCKLVRGTSTLIADMYGDGQTKIINVRGSVISLPGQVDRDSSDFLGYIATLPYKGSSPDKASQWVKQNIGRAASTVIGGVKFELIASSDSARMLIISVAP